jgi:hypothetical protein
MMGRDAPYRLHRNGALPHWQQEINMKFSFFVRDDVFCAGRDELGDPVEALAYYVVAQTEAGRRFAHERSFVDGGVWRAGETAANHLLGRIEKAYAAGVELDMDRWAEIDPEYGSLAYQGLDNEKFFRNREIMEAHDAGEISQNEASLLMMR